MRDWKFSKLGWYDMSGCVWTVATTEDAILHQSRSGTVVCKSTIKRLQVGERTRITLRHIYIYIAPSCRVVFRQRRQIAC